MLTRGVLVGWSRPSILGHHARLARYPELLRYHMTGDVRALDRFLRAQIPLAKSYCAKFVRQYPRLDAGDIYGATLRGLMLAAQKFDPSRGSYSTCAKWWAFSEIQRVTAREEFADGRTDLQDCDASTAAHEGSIEDEAIAYEGIRDCVERMPIPEHEQVFLLAIVNGNAPRDARTLAGITKPRSLAVIEAFKIAWRERDGS